jgi:hypothetical protein
VPISDGVGTRPPVGTQGALRASAATGVAVDRMVDNMAGGAERLGKALTSLEGAAVVRRVSAATQGAFASMASAAESALESAAAAAAKVKARRGEARGGGDALTAPVPRLVAACVHWLAAAGLDTEGIFSDAGSADAVAKLAAVFAADPASLVPLCSAPADVASFLKGHLAALPAPLLPYDVLARPGAADSARATEALYAVSPTARATAELLLSLAARIASLSVATKMDAPKLARVLAPAFTRRAVAAVAVAAPVALASPPGSPLPAEPSAAAGAPSPEAADGAAEKQAAEAEAEDAAVVAAIRWMIVNWEQHGNRAAPTVDDAAHGELSD